MPSILDYFDNPDFIKSVVGGGDSSSFSPPPSKPPEPPSWDVMAKAPPTFGGYKGADPANSGPMNPAGFDSGLVAPVGMMGPTGPQTPMGAPAPGPINGPVPPMPPPNPFAAPPPPMPRPKPMDMAPQPQRFEGGAFGGMGFKPDGWDDMTPPPMESGKGNPPPMVPEVDPAAPGNAMAFAGAPQTRNGFPYTDDPGMNLNRTRSEVTEATNKPRTDEIAINRTPRNGTSMDDMDLARPTPVGNPMDIRSPAQNGQADPRIARARQFGNFLQGLGKGLSAPTRPGAGKGASFIAGAGGALTGYGDHEDKNLARDERGLDRGEKRRVADQTFDYRNRTLDANKDYHNKLLDQHSLDRGERTSRADADREERENRENWKPLGTQEGKPVFYNSKTRETVVGQEKLDQKIAAGGQSGSTERLADRLIADAKKSGQTLSLQDALAIVKRAPKDASAEDLRRETLAQRGALADPKYSRNPEATLDAWRTKYGIKVAPPPGPPPARTMGSDASRPTAPPPPGGAPPPVPASPPPVSAAPKIPPRPAHLPPGSQYSPSLGIWRAPPDQPPQS